MALKFAITVIEHPTEQDHQVIFEGINAYARSQGCPVGAGSYFFAVYDDKKQMIGAISGFDNFGQVEIGGLWVHEQHRGRGYGRALVQQAEEWGRKQGCKMATVFTIKEWSVFAWYLKLGFAVDFERPGHANNSIGCYLSKKL